MENPPEANPPFVKKPKKSKLEIFQIDEFTAKEAYDICRDYVLTEFVPRNSEGKRLPFCTTKDGIAVEFLPQNVDHYLTCEDDKTGMPVIDKMRLQRVEWARPIIQETARVKILKKDFSEKRLYYVPQKEYIVILNRRSETLFRLNTAYRVTKKDMRKKLEKMFPRT